MSVTSSPQRSRCLLVGSTSRVGSFLRRFAEGGASQLQWVFQARQEVQHPPCEMQWSPLEGAEGLIRWVESHGCPEVLFMFAGATPGRGGDVTLHRALAVACLEAAEQVGIRRVLLASSAAVYGRGQGRPFSESDPLAPENDYGRAKVEMEHAVDPWRERGLEVCNLRIGNVAGADLLLLNAARATPDQPVRLDQFADGRGPIRSYLGPATLFQILEALALHKTPLPAVLNLAAPEPVTMESLLQAAGVPWEFTPAPESAIQEVTLDTTRLAARYPISPEESSPEEMVRQWRTAQR